LGAGFCQTNREVETRAKIQIVWPVEKVSVHDAAIYPYFFVAILKTLIVDDRTLIWQASDNIVSSKVTDNPAWHQIERISIVRCWREGWCKSHFCRFAGNEGWRSPIVSDRHNDFVSDRPVRNFHFLESDAADHQLWQLYTDCGLSGKIGCIGGNFSRLQSPKNQITLSRAYYDQSTSKNNQEKIKPPRNIIWWRRWVVFFVFLFGAFYTTCNGLSYLLRGRKIYGWCWLGGAIVFGQLATFTLWLGFGRFM
jgi:hypothetical protein